MDGAVEAADDLHKVIKEELLCDIGAGKSAVVASHPSIANALRDKLGNLKGGSPCDQAPNLGVDFAPGRRRGLKSRKLLRGSRFAKGVARKSRLTQLRYMLGKRVAAYIYAAGILPAITYGVTAKGLSTSERGILMRIAGVATASAKSGRFLTASLLLGGDPSWNAAAAVSLKWQREVWRASGPRRDKARLNPLLPRCAYDLATLTEMWNSVAEQEYQWNDKLGLPKWNMVRGPEEATVLTV
jgi:hypothetical protein